MRAFKILCCAVALAAFTVPSAHADDWNKKTLLTFSGPVQVPGTTLPAGTYMFKLADLETNRHVVQIFDKDGGKLIATFMTVADYKSDVPKNNVVMFQERPKGMAPAIQAWWYVGDTTGDEFVYPKTQAFKIAKATHKPVLATNDDKAATSTNAMKGTSVGRAQENGEMIAENASPDAPRGTEAPPSATGTTAAHSDMAGVGTSGSAARSTRRTRTQLPRTASSLSLVELLAAA
ncbi:MAG TPA: hypothetical protein VIJ16_07710, partial [Gemmatimonadaceae bacterium]